MCKRSENGIQSSLGWSPKCWPIVQKISPTLDTESASDLLPDGTRLSSIARDFDKSENPSPIRWNSFFDCDWHFFAISFDIASKFRTDTSIIWIKCEQLSIWESTKDCSNCFSGGDIAQQYVIPTYVSRSAFLLPSFHTFSSVHVKKWYQTSHLESTGCLHTQSTNSWSWTRRCSTNCSSYLPEICLSGKGGIGIKQNLSTSRSCNQSKCLYRRET